MVGRAFLVLAAAGALAAPVPPGWIEHGYSRLVFAALQPRLTALSNLVGWAVTDVIVACWLAWLGWWAWRSARAIRSHPSLHVFVWRVSGLAAAASVLCLWFLLAWGFNYRKSPLSGRIDYSSHRITADAIVSLAERAAIELNRLHAPAHQQGWPDWDPMADQLSEAAGRVWQSVGVPAAFRLGRPKRSVFTLGFSRAGISGFTSPFALEVVPDWRVPAVLRSDVLGHEWAHLAGFADEAEAGYVGWLTGIEGPVWAQYSAWLTLYPRLAAGLAAGGRRPG
jgi:hypothetical protein